MKPKYFRQIIHKRFGKICRKPFLEPQKIRFSTVARTHEGGAGEVLRTGEKGIRSKLKPKRTMLRKERRE